jgi:hypothetical protein
VRRERLPLDGRSYIDAVRELERLIRATPDLSNLATIRAFLVAAPPGLLGVRTAEDCGTADDVKLRVLIRYMILGTKAMEDLHGLSDPERRWVLAMAIAAGERRQWKEDDLQRFAAYLTMGGASFADERILSDAQIAAKHGVPESAAAFRRSLDDLNL